jgi:hypothetical protein
MARKLGAAEVVASAHQLSGAFPEVGVLTQTTETPGMNEGAALKIPIHRSSRFFDYLDERSAGRLGDAGKIALTIAPTVTPWENARWEAEPDLVDVLRVTLGGDRAETARLFDDFAVRSFFRGQTDGSPVFVDWKIEGESLPRAVAFSRSVEPTGSVYLRLLLSEKLRTSVIAFRTSCEAPVSYVWSVSRLDRKGAEISRFPLTFKERGGDASGRVLPQAEMEELLLVGTNVGGVDLAHPFDPDHGPHEAHGCTVAINVVPSGGASAKER